MSSSATSDSSLHSSRPDKRPATPEHSPYPKRARPALDSPWSDPATPDHADPADLDSSRVQLPSLASAFSDRHDSRRGSLPNLYSENPASRLRLPYPVHRPSQSSSSGLQAYQFPAQDAPDAADNKPERPRLDTQPGGFYPGPVSDLSSSLPSAASTSPFGFSPHSSSDFSVNSGRSAVSPSGLSDPDSWSGASIARPRSTPGVDSLGGPQSMFGGVQRISGHSADRAPVPRLGPANGIKSESDWTFPNGAPDFGMSSASPSGLSAGGSNPAINVTTSPTRSPQSAPAGGSPGSLVDRPPQRKRGKLPKPVTDFLKDWLHRHSDHPYPSEEEKKQLCHATGLSMSQVSNWMINVCLLLAVLVRRSPFPQARRRILAPARHSTAGPTTTTPFATRGGVGMGMPAPGMGGLGVPSPLDTGRRMSMPTDSLQLYYPMSLQSLDPHGHQMSTRHMVNMSRSMSSSHATAGSIGLGHHGHGHSPYGMSDSSYAQGRLSYGSTTALHPSSTHPHHGGSSTSPGGFFGMSSSGGGGNYLGGSPIYGQSTSYAQSSSHHHAAPSPRVLTPGNDDQAGYRFPEHSASPGPQSGSGYGTPQ